MRPKLILVVEDDVELRRQYRAALLFDGFAVREAGDGYSALSEFEQYRPDLVVLDLGLPILDGFAVKSEITARSATRNTPIVVVTGMYVDVTQIDVACVLSKPVLPDDLVQTVRRCLSGEAAAAV